MVRIVVYVSASVCLALARVESEGNACPINVNSLVQFSQGATEHFVNVDQEQVESHDATTQKLGATDEEELGTVTSSVDGDVAVRPGAGGDADVVRFGIYEKAFYGINMKDFFFTMDSVLTLEWIDSRVSSLIPDGQEELTLSAKDALKKLWMPEVVITNREIRGFELVSTSVTVRKGGNVTKVERSLSKIKVRCVLEAFPFDKQILETRVASSKYMLNEVKLESISGGAFSGVNDGLFKSMGWFYDKHEVSVFEEMDGSLQKSRGSLQVTVTREARKYYQNHLLPSVLLMSISCGVFWFPFQQPFITPRLALSILALLTFVTLCRQFDALLPAGAPFCWNDLYNMNCMVLMFFTIVCNITTEIIFHQFQCKELGQQINHETKVVWPTLAFIGFGVVFCSTSGEQLILQATVSMIILTGGYVSFIVLCVVRVWRLSVDDADDGLHEDVAKAVTGTAAVAAVEAASQEVETSNEQAGGDADGGADA